MMRGRMVRGAKPTGAFNVVRATDGTVLGQVTLYQTAGPFKAHFQWVKVPDEQSMPVAGDLLQAVASKPTPAPAPPQSAPRPAPKPAPAPTKPGPVG
jgi:hypothetical protein